MHDQAEKLRKQIQSNSPNTNTRVIAVTSGKGGVGKSNFSLNFALSLVEVGQKVVILDADLGLANIDVLMGVSPQHHLFQMVDQRLSIWDIIEKGPGGVEYIAGRSDFTKLSLLDEYKLSYLFEQLNHLEGYADTIIIDTGAGLTKEALQFILSANDIFLITTPEPTSITDAYAIIKMIHSKNPFAIPQLVINRVTSTQEGKIASERLSAVAKRFLGIELKTIGFIQEDSNILKAVKQQEPFFITYPNTTASENLRKITKRFLHPDENIDEQGKGMKGFLQKMLNLIR